MSQAMEGDARVDPGARKSKGGADYDALDREIEAQRAVALKEGKLNTAIETLLNSEKQMRLAADIVGTRKIVLAIMQLCREMQAWKELNDQIVLISKRRAQLKQAVSAMVKQCMQYIDETPDLETRVELIKTLNTVSAGKIYVELERARLVRRLAKIKEEQGMIAEAAELMQEIAPPPRKVPRTIENTREVDETIAQPDDEELHAEDAADEFSAHFNQEITPQLLITSSRWCSTTTIKFIAELLRVLPNAHYYKRGSYEIKQIVKYAKNRDFTAIIIVHDNRKEPNGILVISLPDGPTAHFKISNLVLSKKIKGHGKPTSHLPELILNNFTTRIGHRVGRMLASLFPQQPNFQGRRVVTFHNQRDFIFFRHHRYIFEEKDATTKGKSKLKGASKESSTNGKRPHKDLVIARLQECGPRFTLKLLSLQHGTFDSKFGEYEWVHKADMDTSRRRFFM